MTMPLTYKAANAYLDLLTMGQPVPNWKTYLGLSTTAPNRDGSGYTEPDASVGYGRAGLNAAPLRKMKFANLGASTNEDTIFFPEATASWGKITYFLIFDAEKEGNLLAYGPLDDPITPSKGKVPIIRTENITITMR